MGVRRRETARWSLCSPRAATPSTVVMPERSPAARWTKANRDCDRIITPTTMAPIFAIRTATSCVFVATRRRPDNASTKIRFFFFNVPRTPFLVRPGAENGDDGGGCRHHFAGGRTRRFVPGRARRLAADCRRRGLYHSRARPPAELHCRERDRQCRRQRRHRDFRCHLCGAGAAPQLVG